MDIILKYFPNLSEVQQQQFAALYDLYTDWNSKINVISRKDITNLYEHHVLHSLGIAKVMQFRPETTVMDLGTGGGFPGDSAGYSVSGNTFPSGGQHRQESEGGYRNCQCHRFEERHHPSLPCGGRKAIVRLRGKQGRHAADRLAENHPQEYQEGTAQCPSQRTDLSEGR